MNIPKFILTIVVISTSLQTLKAETFSSVISTGNIRANGNVISDNNITANNNITAVGSVSASGNVTAGAGNLVASMGNVRAPMGTITAGDNMYANSNLVVGLSPGYNNYLFVYGYAQTQGAAIVGTNLTTVGSSYLGAYSGGYALTVNKADGSVVLKKAQGDISMGIYGN